MLTQNLVQTQPQDHAITTLTASDDFQMQAFAVFAQTLDLTAIKYKLIREKS